MAKYACTCSLQHLHRGVEAQGLHALLVVYVPWMTQPLATYQPCWILLILTRLQDIVPRPTPQPGVRQDFLCEIGNHALRIKLILVIPPSSIKCSLTNVFSYSSVRDYWNSGWYSHMPKGLIRLARVDPHYHSKKMAHCL